MRHGWFLVASPQSLRRVARPTTRRIHGARNRYSLSPGERWLATLRASFLSAPAARLLGDTWPYLIGTTGSPDASAGRLARFGSALVLLSPKSFISSLYLHTPFLITRVGSCRASVNAGKPFLSPCFSSN